MRAAPEVRLLDFAQGMLFPISVKSALGEILWDQIYKYDSRKFVKTQFHETRSRVKRIGSLFTL